MLNKVLQSSDVTADSCVGYLCWGVTERSIIAGRKRTFLAGSDT